MTALREPKKRLERGAHTRRREFDDRWPEIFLRGVTRGFIDGVKRGNLRIIVSPAMLAMITALNRPAEINGHSRGALNNGATPAEIMGVFHPMTVYCGFPAANGAVCAGAEVFKKLGLI